MMAFQKKLSTTGEAIREESSTQKEAVARLNAELTALAASLHDAKQARQLAEYGLERAFETQGDIHEAFRAVKASEDAVRLAEAAQASMARRIDDATERLGETEKALQREELLVEVEKLGEAAKEVDAAITRLSASVEKWRKAALLVHARGYHELDAKLKSAIQLFRVRVLDNCGFPEHRTGLDVFVKNKPWADDQICADDVVRVTTPQGGTAA